MLATALLLLPLPGAAAQEPPAGEPARIAAGGAEVRAFPKDTVVVVERLEPGTPVRILEERPPWARVAVPGGLPAWIHGDYFEFRENGRGRVRGTHVRIRPLPSTASESHPLGQYRDGAELQVLGRDGDWVRVLAPESAGGWVLLVQLQRGAGEGLSWEEAAARRRGAWRTRGRQEEARARAAVRHAEAPPPAPPLPETAVAAALEGARRALQAAPAEREAARRALAAVVLGAASPQSVVEALELLEALDRD